MQRDHHRWYSHRLNRDMGVAVYGHYGMPILAFPTSMGDEWEQEGQGMIRTLSPYLDQALDLPADARALWLEGLRATDPALAAEVEALLAENESGRDLTFQLWTLISFELWARHFLDGAARPHRGWDGAPLVVGPAAPAATVCA